MVAKKNDPQDHQYSKAFLGKVFVKYYILLDPGKQGDHRRHSCNDPLILVHQLKKPWHLKSRFPDKPDNSGTGIPVKRAFHANRLDISLPNTQTR